MIQKSKFRLSPLGIWFQKSHDSTRWYPRLFKRNGFGISITPSAIPQVNAYDKKESLFGLL